MYQFKRILMMDLGNLFTNPMWIGISIGLPLALVLILGFLASGSYGDIVSSYDYYGVALLIFAILLNSTTIAANSFMEERIKDANMRIVFSPVPTYLIPLSKVVSSFLFCSVCALVTAILLSVLVGVNYGGAHFFGPLTILTLSILLFTALGVLVCCILKDESAANNLLSLVVTIFAFLGGMFFPLAGLGRAMTIASWLSPAKWIFSACMRMIYDGDFSLLVPASIILIALSALVLLLIRLTFSGEDYL
jgi:ABC-2 type transport system permease protein